MIKNRTDLKTLDFTGFQHFLLQMAIQLIQRPPSLAKHAAPFQGLQALLNHFRLIIASRKQSLALFDDPDTQYFSQTEIIKEFNERLKADPEYILPEGFKKVQLIDLEFKYELMPILRLQESQ